MEVVTTFFARQNAAILPRQELDDDHQGSLRRADGLSSQSRGSGAPFSGSRLMVRSFPSGTEVHKIIQDRINSREWWLMPVIDEEGIAFVQEIACRFYRDNRKG